MYKHHFAVSVGAWSLLLIMFPSLLGAGVIFSYTGNPFPGGPIIVTFDSGISGIQLDNIPPGTDITQEILGGGAFFFAPFSMTDPPPAADLSGFAVGVNNFVGPFTVQIRTDSLGNITSWNIIDMLFVSYPSFPGENPFDFYCVYTVTTSTSQDSQTLTTDNDSGLCPTGSSLNNSPGVWSPTFENTPVTTPEPRAPFLVGSGVLVLLAAGLYRRHHNAKTPLPGNGYPVDQRDSAASRLIPG